MERFTDVVIPDAELEEYLKGKLLVKPDYGFDTEVKSDLTSRWVEARAAVKKDRKDNNDRTKRGYRL